jgi:hypothetical protein
MTDVATLGIQVETAGVERGMVALDKLANAALIAEKAAQSLGNGFDNSMSLSAAAIDRMAAQMGKVANISQKAQYALTNIGNAATKAGTALKGSGQNVSNLAFQFQDLTTMMAMGQSPFMLLAQQLPQITMYGGSLNGVMSALKVTLAGLFSPLGLLTTGFVLLGSAAISYFTELWNRGSQSEEVLAKQEAMIGRVATKWGEAYPAIKQYNDEIIRTRDLAELASAVEIVKQDKLKDIPAALEAITFEMSDFLTQLRLAGEEEGQIIDLQNAFNRAKEAISQGRSATDDLNTAMGILRNGIENQANPAVAAMIDLLATLMAQASKTAAAVASVVNSAANIQNLTTSQISANNAGWVDDGGFRRTAEFVPGGNLPTPGARPLIELEGMPKITGGSSATQSAYDSATKSMAEQTRALQAQTAAQAALNPLVNDYGFAMTKAKAAADLLAAAERDKKAITPELTADINAQATALAAATAAQARQTEAVNNAKAAMEAAKGAATGFLSTMRQGLIAGEGWWRSFGNAAMSVLDKIMSAMETSFVNSLFTSSATGGVGIFGKLFGFAGGTDFAPGGMAVVGERGPEIVNLPRGSQVIPNHRIGSVAANQNIHVTSDIRVDMDPSGQWKANVKHVSTQTVQAAAPRIVGAAVTEAGRRVVPSLAKHQTQKAGGDWRNGG